MAIALAMAAAGGPSAATVEDSFGFELGPGETAFALQIPPLAGRVERVEMTLDATLLGTIQFSGTSSSQSVEFESGDVRVDVLPRAPMAVALPPLVLRAHGSVEVDAGAHVSLQVTSGRIQSVTTQNAGDLDALSGPDPVAFDVDLSSGIEAGVQTRPPGIRALACGYHVKGRLKITRWVVEDPLGRDDPMGPVIGPHVVIPVERLLANDSGTGGGPAAIASVAAQSAVGFPVELVGRYVHYRPGPTFQGADSFTYAIHGASPGTTDPTVSLTILRRLPPPPLLPGIRRHPAGLQMDWLHEPGALVHLERTADLLRGPWDWSGTAMADSGGNLVFLDADTGSSGSLFYRWRRD
ncbi:MAG: hypothetical protein KF791_10615 [Verrucomicrobiae bacterium]|nr:hypothetical protein [Verrucomicrobiae bacterium]